jgi:hypothetical protein
MLKQSRSLFSFLILMTFIAVQGVAFGPLARTSPPAQSSGLIGRWRVKFTLSGIGEKNLVFDSQPKGVGSFLLLDTGPDNKPEEGPLPALWSQTSNGRVTLSSEVELQFGTCCREIGTLILKGKFENGNSIKGRAIFIASTEDDENFNGYRSSLGTFTATRMLKD